MVNTKSLSEQDLRSSWWTPETTEDVECIGHTGAWVLYRNKTKKEIYVYVTDYHACPTLVLKESGLKKLLKDLKSNK